MVEFLHGEALSERIREVVQGRNVRCAVAFWGLGAVKELFGTDILERADVHVACDLSMGGTNPATLRALGAPDNQNIRFRDGLHAKVFLSANGAIVGSANASNNGIGFMGGNAQLLEAGTYVAPNSDAWRSIGGWFAKLWEQGSVQVDAVALNAAQLAWNRCRRAGALIRPQDHPGFLEYNPEVDGLVHVIWYTRFAEDPDYIDDAYGRDGVNMAPKDIDLRQSWVCTFRVTDDHFMDRRTNPEIFFADALLEDATQEDEEYKNLLTQAQYNIRPNPPFNFQDRVLISAFKTVINDPQRPYGPLRGEVENRNIVWLARDHIELMHRFWGDVQDEYRRRQKKA